MVGEVRVWSRGRVRGRSSRVPYTGTKYVRDTQGSGRKGRCGTGVGDHGCVLWTSVAGTGQGENQGFGPTSLVVVILSVGA